MELIKNLMEENGVVMTQKPSLMYICLIMEIVKMSHFHNNWELLPCTYMCVCMQAHTLTCTHMHNAELSQPISNPTVI